MSGVIDPPGTRVGPRASQTMEPGRPHGPFGITLGGGSEVSSGPGHAAIAPIATPSPPISINIRALRQNAAVTQTLSSERPLRASGKVARTCRVSAGSTPAEDRIHSGKVIGIRITWVIVE